jgi:hypothetical protein
MIYAFMLLALASDASSDCPLDYKCIPKSVYPDVVKVLKSYQKLQESTPKITVNPWVVLLDREGRIYSGAGDANTDILGTMEWGEFVVAFKFKPVLTMYTRQERDYGFRLRWKAYVYGKVLYYDNPTSMLDAGVGLDFLYWRWLNFQVIVGFMSCGFSLGVDITKNFGIVGGAVNPYWVWRPTPMVGIYFGF